MNLEFTESIEDKEHIDETLLNLYIVQFIKKSPSTKDKKLIDFEFINIKN